VLGLIQEVKKDKDKNIARVLLASGDIIHLEVSPELSEGKIINVDTSKGDYSVSPVNYSDKKKRTSIKFGYVENAKGTLTSKPLIIKELGASPQAIGKDITKAMSAVSETCFYGGYGGYNFFYADRVCTIHKADTHIRIAGNILEGSSIATGQTLRIYLKKILDMNHFNQPGKDFMKKIKQNLYKSKFMVDLLGVYGSVLLEGVESYCVEGVGLEVFENFRNSISLMNDKKIDLSSLVDFLSNYTKLEDIIEFKIVYTNKDKVQINNPNEIILGFDFFGKSYIITHFKAITYTQTIEYDYKKLIINNENHLVTKREKLEVDEFEFMKPFYVNKTSKNLKILNDTLEIDTNKLILSIKELEAIGTDKIELKVGSKGFLINTLGTSNL